MSVTPTVLRGIYMSQTTHTDTIKASNKGPLKRLHNEADVLSLHLLSHVGLIQEQNHNAQTHTWWDLVPPPPSMTADINAVRVFTDVFGCIQCSLLMSTAPCPPITTPRRCANGDVSVDTTMQQWVFLQPGSFVRVMESPDELRKRVQEYNQVMDITIGFTEPMSMFAGKVATVVACDGMDRTYNLCIGEDTRVAFWFPYSTVTIVNMAQSEPRIYSEPSHRFLGRRHARRLAHY